MTFDEKKLFPALSIAFSLQTLLRHRASCFMALGAWPRAARDRARKEGQQKNQLCVPKLKLLVPQSASVIRRAAWNVERQLCRVGCQGDLGQGPPALLFSANSLTSHDWPDDASRRFGCGSASPPPPPAS